MTSTSYPRLVVNLVPTADEKGDLTGLDVTYQIPGPSLQEGAVLFYCPDASSGRSISVSGLEDEGGSIPSATTLSQEAQNSAECRVSRATRGLVVVRLKVAAAAEDSNKVALLQDQGGLVGVGRGFLPRLALPDIMYEIELQWSLASAPAGTKAAWTFGEGSEPVVKLGKADLLLSSVYMAGQIQKVQTEPAEAEGDAEPVKGVCGAYWLGSLPPNFDAVKDFNIKMYPRLSAFFRDLDGSYRVFFRKVSKGTESQILTSSSLIDYDDAAKGESDWELVRLLNKSMISTWTQLDPEDDGSRNDWFTKGISSLYSIYLPYRFGQRTPHYFRATLNGFLSGYFTSPLLQSAFGDIPKEDENWSAGMEPWLRGCVYMIRMDAYTRRASVAQNAGVLRPIDEMVADISERRRKGEKVQAKDWVKHVGKWIGEELAQTHLDRMLDGTPMYLDDMETAFEGIDPVTQEVLDFGFDRISLKTGIVSGVSEGSKAAEAGLENGDVVKWHSRPELCITHFDEKFKLKVDRGDQEVDIEYWPRGTDKVRLWQSFPKESK